MTILNHEYIKKHITTNNGKEDVLYRWSHGATDKHLGDGILIYSLIQFHKYKTLVCLGSGGGFIPRIMSQARYDLSEQGFYKEVGMEWGDNGSTYVVDACNKFNGVIFKSCDVMVGNGQKAALGSRSGLLRHQRATAIPKSWRFSFVVAVTHYG